MVLENLMNQASYIPPLHLPLNFRVRKLAYKQGERVNDV